MRSLQVVLQRGWSLYDAGEGGCIIWKRRHHNQLADYVATKTLEVQQSWERIFNPKAFQGDANICLFVDGGVRKQRGASAWVITVSTPGNQFMVAAGGGIYWQPGPSVTPFMAETCALEAGIDAVERLAGKPPDPRRL